MTKFGDIISVNKPVLIDFYTELHVLDSNLETLKDVAAALGDKAKVIKIDTQKNDILAEALHINSTPTFIIYKGGKMVWRKDGQQDSMTLIENVKKYI